MSQWGLSGTAQRQQIAITGNITLMSAIVLQGIKLPRMNCTNTPKMTTIDAVADSIPRSCGVVISAT